MSRLSYSYYTHLVARELIGVPIEFHFDALCVVAKQSKMKDVKITKTSITATQSNYDLLVRRLIECIYQN